MSPKARVITLVVLVAIAFAAGASTTRPSETKYKVIHVDDTKTVTETVEVPGEPPEECADIVELSYDVTQAASTYETITSRMLGLLSDIRLANAQHDSNAANDIEEEVRALSSSTTEAARILGETQIALRDAQKACEEAQDDEQ